MAARYLGVTYARQVIGSTATFEALFKESGSYQSAAFWSCVEMASAVVGTYLRHQGYEVPTTAGTAYDLMAVTWAPFYEIVCARPENSFALPETWQNHPSKVLYEELKKGQAHLSLSSSHEASEGGVAFTESSTSISTADGSRQNVFSRLNLSDL